MRVLLDECVDRRLSRELTGHHVKTVPQMGWSGVKNGKLMGLAEQEFDIFVTADRNLSFQQNLSKYQIAIVVLHARTNRLVDLISLVPAILESLSTAQVGEVTIVGVRGDK